MLAVEDPKDPSNDLGKGSYNIQKVGPFPPLHQQFLHQRFRSPSCSGSRFPSYAHRWPFQKTLCMLAGEERI